MADPFLAEVRIFAGNFAIYGWAFCNGQIMSISQNAALFSLLGTNFGGNGTSNFGLPNLQGNVVVGAGDGIGLTPRSVGEVGGTPTVTLTQSTMPFHNHLANCDATASGTAQTSPIGGVWSAAKQGKQDLNYYAAAPDGTQMNTAALLPAGGDQPHNNMQPYLALNFIIALVGVYPSRN